MEIPVAVEKVELAESAPGGHGLHDLGIGAVEGHRVVERLVAVVHTHRPGEARLAADVGDQQHVKLDVGELQDALQLQKALLDRLALRRAVVLDHVVLDGQKEFAALRPPLFAVPERLEDLVQGIGEVETIAPGAILAHCLDFLRRVDGLDELDRPVVGEAIADDPEEIVIPNVAFEVLDHISEEGHELREDVRLRNRLEFCHVS